VLAGSPDSGRTGWACYARLAKGTRRGKKRLSALKAPRSHERLEPRQREHRSGVPSPGPDGQCVAQGARRGRRSWRSARTGLRRPPSSRRGPEMSPLGKAVDPFRPLPGPRSASMRYTPRLVFAAHSTRRLRRTYQAMQCDCTGRIDTLPSGG